MLDSTATDCIAPFLIAEIAARNSNHVAVPCGQVTTSSPHARRTECHQQSGTNRVAPTECHQQSGASRVAPTEWHQQSGTECHQQSGTSRVSPPEWHHQCGSNRVAPTEWHRVAQTEWHQQSGTNRVAGCIRRHYGWMLFSALLCLTAVCFRHTCRFHDILFFVCLLLLLLCSRGIIMWNYTWLVTPQLLCGLYQGGGARAQ